MEEDKYNWNLNDIFDSEEDFQREKNRLDEYLDKIVTYKGKLNNSVQEFVECYNLMEESYRAFEKIYGYAMLKYHEDMSNTESIKRFKEVEMLASRFSEAESFITPETSKIDDERLEEYLQDERNKGYEKTIRDIIKDKKHILSEEVEAALASYQEVFSIAENTYDIFTDTEFDFPPIKDDNGNELEMNMALYGRYIMSKNENIRRQAFKSMYSLYKRHINSITELYLGRVKQMAVSSRLRHFESSLDMATNHDDSNSQVYETLVQSVNDFMYLNHEFINLKADLLGKEKLHIYDTGVNVFDAEEEKIHFDDAKEIVLNALNPMGEEYVGMLKNAIQNRWIDVYKKPNKRSGGYSMGVYGVHPYILLNYIDSSRDVSVLAHELGHSMHTYFANKSQNAINANYTIMVAEVASTVNELILANYRINSEQDIEKKKALIYEQLDMIRATLIRQTMFAEFEEIIHSRIGNGESLNSDELNTVYGNLVEKYFGTRCIIDDEIKYEWARIPHFYSPFYVYKYATGITSAIVIASKILAGEEGYVDRYIEMLSKGGSIDSLSLLRMVDVDLEKKETYEIAFRYFESKLNELKSLS